MNNGYITSVFQVLGGSRYYDGLASCKHRKTCGKPTMKVDTFPNGKLWLWVFHIYANGYPGAISYPRLPFNHHQITVKSPWPSPLFAGETDSTIPIPRVNPIKPSLKAINLHLGSSHLGSSALQDTLDEETTGLLFKAPLELWGRCGAAASNIGKGSASVQWTSMDCTYK